MFPDIVETQSFATMVAYVCKNTLFQWNIENFENETWRLKNGKLCNPMLAWTEMLIFHWKYVNLWAEQKKWSKTLEKCRRDNFWSKKHCFNIYFWTGANRRWRLWLTHRGEAHTPDVYMVLLYIRSWRVFNPGLPGTHGFRHAMVLSRAAPAPGAPCI